MNFIQLVLEFLLIQTGFADRNTLPVFMIDPNQIMLDHITDPNPFHRISNSKFANIIHESIKRGSATIIFIEENFSVEDISIKDKQGTPYNNLRRSIHDRKAQYFPAVIEPYKLLIQLFPPHQFNVFYLKSRTKLELVDSFRYVYIYFQDGRNETRANVLRRHDLIIREVSYIVGKLKQAPVVAYYTGKINPVKAETLHFVPVKPNPIPKDLGVMVVSSGGLFRFSDVFAASPTRRSSFNQLPLISDEKISPKSMSTKMSYSDFELEFNFSFLKERWLLDNVALLEAGEEVGRTNMGVGAPWNMSYVCGEPLVIVNSRDGSAVTISQYQIQPRRRPVRRDGDDAPAASSDVDADAGAADAGAADAGAADAGAADAGAADAGAADAGGGAADADGTVDTGTSFGDSTNCGLYFSAPILSTLMVTSICFSILIYGVVSLMAVKSNDRYEDPMSKPLVHVEN